VQLSQLVKKLADSSSDVEVTAVAESLNQVVPGALFGCVKGSTVDGHDLAPQAVEKGAVALLVERHLDLDVPQVEVEDVRKALGACAAEFWGHPADRLEMVGVTGTNGKTTTTHLLTEVFAFAGRKAKVLGTLSGHFTTPPAVDLHRVLAEMVGEGADTVSMEVSSAGLAQHRVEGVKFRVGVFTNLSQDHLDYHGSMERYFEAKAKLFEAHVCEVAVINVDDPWGRLLADNVSVPVSEVSMNDADALMMRPDRSKFSWRGHGVDLPLVGSFNVYNALCAAAAAEAAGISRSVIAEALSKVSPVPGRFEVIDGTQPFGVIVDFAHTPDGLDNVLSVASSLAEADGGRVIAVFGCGGDRDQDKRPKMGAVAEKYSAAIFVTNDNPRSEDPQDIANQILAGMSLRSDVVVELDRAKAIGSALATAQQGDVVVIAGKGHESTQEAKGVKTAFDDRLEAARALRVLGFQSGEKVT
jgi:UDP-N-acetylmuramoyl-L-alanyl-D-glutamate--2,6-diaminopimelate ligase